MRRFISDLLGGTILAAVAAALSCLLAFAGFGQPYYLSVFLPLSMFAYILVAWLLHLRGDGLMAVPPNLREGGAGVIPDTATRRDEDRFADAEPSPGDGRPPASLLLAAARWDEEPLRRASPQAGIEGKAFSPRAKQALLWAAAELGLGAGILYSLWGIGAVFY